VGVHAMAMPTKTDIRAGSGMARTIAALAPDVLHCQDRRAGLVGRLVGRRYGVGAVVYTVHGVPDGLSTLVAGCAQAEPRRIVRDPLYCLVGERLMSAVAPGPIVVPCEALAEYVRRHLRQPAGSVHVVPNGVDLQRFRPTAGPDSSGVTAVWVGLMKQVKRVDELVRLVADVPGLELQLVGSGPIRDQVAATVRHLEASDRISLSGFHADPAGALAAADVFVLPSAAEAFPLALLQAMASGLPVVATRVGGVPDLVREGIDGFLIDADDWPAFRAALARLTGDAGLRATMGRAARQRVVEAFSLDVCIKRLLQVYEGAAA
jgi:glycosyltransferase involved in cell wall biosynthesis